MQKIANIEIYLTDENNGKWYGKNDQSISDEGYKSKMYIFNGISDDHDPVETIIHELVHTVQNFMICVNGNLPPDENIHDETFENIYNIIKDNCYG